ncbi:4-hydroxy-tetrahydrodipicolinate reductase [Anaerocolumna sedimenticola]|uniref:4-hydroxy-tetrahydrodipicolinate reductase n=1 Tax=Anaerocolumna sedimenticola TaxID=2696063 RepID=A0A6P1TP32_9FIRM|nr:4-hydroxy-tetrahydrodipicolinate reductase [Anaerocolumna sedimenticola]QHQ61148.1 4-hydroxy-tetrahydrodipicolinate reductase [Anaerocolumna sedimenticola]
MTRIILRGCNGRMGQEITKLLKSDEQAVIVAGVDLHESTGNGYPVFTSFSACNVLADVIIDFSSPQKLNEMLAFAERNQLPVVLCTTGLSENDLAMVKKASQNIAILRSANMSVGVNTVMKLLKTAAQVLAAADFDIEIVEKHHNQKLDAPSGTALALADVMNQVLNQEYDYNFDRSRERKKREKKEIGISAVRGGTIIGEHEVIFAGLDEVIEIKHTAYSRAIFAKGAIHAAKFLADKVPGMYEMSDAIG